MSQRFKSARVLGAAIVALGLAGGLTLSLVASSTVAQSSAPGPQERALLASLARATPATPGDPIYASIGPICGPTTVLGAKCFTSVSSVEFAAEGGGGINLSDVSLTLPMNEVTPPMLADLTGHTVLGSATLEFVSTINGKLHDYLKIVLTDVVVDSVSLASGGSNPDISASLKFSVIKLTYFTGSVGSTFCWNVGTLSAC
jgi:type VI protein secretion system component Hcp